MGKIKGYVLFCDFYFSVAENSPANCVLLYILIDLN